MAILINPISPIAISLFGFDIRWYALAYIVAFVVGYWMFKRLNNNGLNKKQLDDLLTYIVLGVILGGRLGYVLFYNLPFFIQNPLEIFMVWHGGMAFHGGLIGILISVLLFAKTNIKNSFKILDLLAVIAPIGLFFGRIANFINMEIMGRPTNGPLGVVFRGYDPTPRYPSPLFEAALEGIVLFIIMFYLWKFTKLRERTGALSGVFAIVYAIFRIICEQFRAPDTQIGFLTDWGLTMGGLLSTMMLTAGVAVLIYSCCKNKC